VLDFIKKNWPDIPVALLTNGSLFNHEQVRKQILKADLVLPSLDAASDSTFHKIDRPFHEITIEEYIQGLVDFRKEYKGTIWLEVLILPDINDGIKDLQLLKNAISKINPDKIQLNTLDRPGTINNLRPANKAELQQIMDSWDFTNTEIIASVPERKDMKSYREDTENAILETISRRPCTLNDLGTILGIHINEINKYLGVLDGDGKIETNRQKRGVFYQTRHK